MWRHYDREQAQALVQFNAILRRAQHPESRIGSWTHSFGVVVILPAHAVATSCHPERSRGGRLRLDSALFAVPDVSTTLRLTRQHGHCIDQEPSTGQAFACHPGAGGVQDHSVRSRIPAFAGTTSTWQPQLKGGLAPPTTLRHRKLQRSLSPVRSRAEGGGVLLVEAL